MIKSNVSKVFINLNLRLEYEVGNTTIKHITLKSTNGCQMIQLIEQRLQLKEIRYLEVRLVFQCQFKFTFQYSMEFVIISLIISLITWNQWNRTSVVLIYLLYVAKVTSGLYMITSSVGREAQYRRKGRGFESHLV